MGARNLFLHFIVLLLLVPIGVAAQPTIKRVKRYTSFIEEFSVLKTDERVRHGYFRRKHIDGHTMIQGHFNQGEQSGLWKEFHDNGQLLSQGSYSDGYKAGVWFFADKKGRVVQKYDYTAQKLVYYGATDEEQDRFYKVMTEEGIIQTKIDRPPVFIGGNHIMRSLINQGLKLNGIDYRSIKGEIIISILIKKTGEAAEHRVERSGASSVMTSDVLEAVKSLPGLWIPGTLRNEPIDVYLDLVLFND